MDVKMVIEFLKKFSYAWWNSHKNTFYSEENFYSNIFPTNYNFYKYKYYWAANFEKLLFKSTFQSVL